MTDAETDPQGGQGFPADGIPESFYELVYGPEKPYSEPTYMTARLRGYVNSRGKTAFKIQYSLKTASRTRSEAILKFQLEHPRERLFEARSITSALKTYASFSEFSGEYSEITA